LGKNRWRKKWGREINGTWGKEKNGNEKRMAKLTGRACGIDAHEGDENTSTAGKMNNEVV